MSADELEQYDLELLNRMRLEPAAELGRLLTSTSPPESSDLQIRAALNFFHVDGPTLVAQWATLTPAPPLAWSDTLAGVAMTHDALMIADDSQSHSLPGEADIQTRAVAAGYTDWTSLREDIFLAVNSIPYNHAGLAIDWGIAPDGIQDPPDHRENMMATDVQEIGIAVISSLDVAGHIGPLVVTEDFGDRTDFPGPMVLGVAFQDTAGTGWYLPGEELAGISVNVDGTITSTADAGGYQATASVGSVPVTFSGGALTTALSVLLVVGSDNVKLDVTGLDSIDSSASLALGEGVRKAVLLGQVDGLAIRGNDLGDTLVGTGNNDQLVGGSGDDVLEGGGGSDTLNGMGGTNTAVFAGDLAAFALARSGANILVTGDGGTDTLTNIQTLQFDDTSIPAGSVACFAAGTRLRTPAGETEVEALAVGDAVLTAQGPRPVRWVGWRGIDCDRHARPWDVWPVLVRRDAFGEGRPGRDLLLSPDHAVLVDEVLIPVRYLLNGASIVQLRRRRVVYFHVELDRHGILLAEGLETESYLDTGNRSAFANGGAALALHADFSRKIWAAQGCAPLVLAGPAVVAVRRRLLARTQELGFVLAGDADLHLWAGGATVQPRIASFGLYRFVLPADTAEVEIRSRAGVPAEMAAEGYDGRCLGVMLERIFLHGREIGLETLAEADGFHALEREGARRWRWTDGAARLRLPGDRARGVLDLHVAAVHPGWVRGDVRQRATRYH